MTLLALYNCDVVRISYCYHLCLYIFDNYLFCVQLFDRPIPRMTLRSWWSWTLHNTLRPLFMWCASCSALFIDGCGALIRLKHTGLRSHSGVIIGLGGGITGGAPLSPTTSIKVKSYVESEREGRRQRGAKERFNPGLSLIYLLLVYTFSLSTVHANRFFFLWVFTCPHLIGRTLSRLTSNKRPI